MKGRKKPAWVVLGWVSLALAIVGIFLPVIPQVPFAIFAAFCVSKGSPRLHHWILNHNSFGAAVRDWEMDQVVRVRLKLVSIGMMIGGAAMAYWRFREENPAVAISTAILFFVASIFIATRRSHTRMLPEPKFEVRMPRTFS